MYARYINENLIDTDLPTAVVYNGVHVFNPTDPTILASVGIYPVEEDECPGDGFVSRYTFDGSTIRKTWVESGGTSTDVSRTFSKYKLKLAIAQLGLLGQFTEMLAGFEVAPGYPADEAFRDAVTLDEDNPKFQDAVELVKREFGLTDEQIEGILSASVAG